MVRAHLLIVTLLLVAARPACADTIRVLFVGNSLTYTNDLPWMVAALSKGRETGIEAGMIAFPNASLEDHWSDGRVRSEIASGRWDVVVMQQGPSSLSSSRVNLIEWSSRIAVAARASGTRPAMFTVWPDSSRRAYLGQVIESYRLAAEKCGCELLPAGAAWEEAWKRNGRVSLYGADGFHPSEEGSFLAALVIWGGLTGEDVRSAPSELELPDGRSVRVREKRAAVYREAAAAALAPLRRDGQDAHPERSEGS